MAPTPDPRPAASVAPAAEEALAAPRRGFLAAGWAKFSDNAIPSLVVAVIAGLVLFFFNETSDQIIRLEDRITRLEADHDARFSRLEADHDARFTKLEENQQEIAVTLGTLVGEFAAFERDVDNRFAAVETRLTRLEENQQEITRTLARLVVLVETRFESDGAG